MDVFRLVLLLVVLQGDIEKMRTASSSWPGLFLAKHAPGVADVPAMIDEPQPFHPIDQVSIRDSKGFTFEALDTDHVTRVQVLWINIAGDRRTVRSRRSIVECQSSSHGYITGNSRWRLNIERCAVLGLDGSRFAWKTE